MMFTYMFRSFNLFKENITHQWFLLNIIPVYKYMKVFQFLDHLTVENYTTVNIK